MASNTCTACGEGAVALDSEYGIYVCESCGLVVDDVETFLGSRHQEGHVMERGGTLVRSGETGALAACGLGRPILQSGNHQDENKREVMNKMKEVAAILRVPHERVDDVKFMLEQLLDGEWGQGRWIEILVGACIYVAIRQGRLPLALVEVASAVDCGIAELGRMYKRVVEALKIELPAVDAVVFLERALASLARSKGIDRGLTRKMSKEGSLLLEFSHQSFIITGRRALPVVAAVIFLVTVANEIHLKLDDVVLEVHSCSRTSGMRLQELKRALVGFGQKLPWGKDIEVETVDKHLPTLLEYLNSYMKRGKKRKGQAPERTLSKCSSMRSPVELVPSRGEKSDDLGDLALELEPASARNASEKGTSTSTRQSEQVLEDRRSVELTLVEALKQKDVKWQAWPESFLVGADARSRRCLKIRAAVERIKKAKQGLLTMMGKNELQRPQSVASSRSIATGVESAPGKQREVEVVKPPEEKKRKLDCEDLVIEYLLLRGVNHAQLEDGYYKAALGVHNMQSADQIDDDELIQYLRSKAEVNLMRSLHDGKGVLSDPVM